MNAASDPTSEQLDNLLRDVFDIGYRTETIHESDCPACDFAADIAGTLATAWDPHENWYETEVSDGIPGDTLLDQVTRIVAFVLHRRMLGLRPPLDELLRKTDSYRGIT